RCFRWWCPTAPPCPRRLPSGPSSRARSPWRTASTRSARASPPTTSSAGCRWPRSSCAARGSNWHGCWTRRWCRRSRSRPAGSGARTEALVTQQHALVGIAHGHLHVDPLSHALGHRAEVLELRQHLVQALVVVVVARELELHEDLRDPQAALGVA